SRTSREKGRNPRIGHFVVAVHCRVPGQQGFRARGEDPAWRTTVAGLAKGQRGRTTFLCAHPLRFSKRGAFLPRAFHPAHVNRPTSLPPNQNPFECNSLAFEY